MRPNHQPHGLPCEPRSCSKGLPGCPADGRTRAASLPMQALTWSAAARMRPTRGPWRGAAKPLPAITCYEASDLGHLHRRRIVAEALALLGRMADAGPWEMIG